MANFLTAIRLVLAAPFAYLIYRGGGGWDAATALLIFWVAVATDATDGPLARRRGTASAAGGTFDHVSDFLFVTAATFAGAARGAFPWIYPVLIVAAFAQYTLDSYLVQRRGKLRGSWLGRWNGILYFAPPCVDCIERLGWRGLEFPLRIFVWLLVASTLVSMGQRLRMTFGTEQE